jgi:hypothetical protein
VKQKPTPEATRPKEKDPFSKTEKEERKMSYILVFSCPSRLFSGLFP